MTSTENQLGSSSVSTDSSKEISKAVNAGFNKFQAFWWPIHAYELKKFLPMCFLMFCILFVYAMVRDLKDVFIQTYAIGGGVHLLASLKLFFVMPVAIIAVMIFTNLVNKFGKSKTFYIIISSFLCFYAVFVTIIFPNIDKLQGSSEQLEHWQNICPVFLHNIIPCFINWAYTLFYVFSEMWGTMVISLLFWQFANQITKKSEVKRFFGLFSTIGNLGVIFAGNTLKTMANVKNEDAFDAHVKILMCGVLVFGVLIMLIYKYINSVVMKDPRFKNDDEVSQKKSKEKVGMMQGVKILYKFKYLRLISVLVVGFGFCNNFVEILLREKMLEVFPTKTAYSNMASNLTIVTGIFSIIANLLSANILRRCKWRTSALATPMILLTLGSAFLGLVLWGEKVSPQLLGFNVLGLAVAFGISVDALSKSSKFSLFDTTKSMAYLPLDEDTKIKGQAAVEVIAGRFGKVGAAAIQYVLLGIVNVGGKLSSHLFVIIPVFLATIFGWISSVFKLSDKYEKAVGRNKMLE